MLWTASTQPETDKVLGGRGGGASNSASGHDRTRYREERLSWMTKGIDKIIAAVQGPDGLAVIHLILRTLDPIHRSASSAHPHPSRAERAHQSCV